MCIGIFGICVYMYIHVYVYSVCICIYLDVCGSVGVYVTMIPYSRFESAIY